MLCDTDANGVISRLIVTWAFHLNTQHGPVVTGQLLQPTIRYLQPLQAQQIWTGCVVRHPLHSRLEEIGD